MPYPFFDSVLALAQWCDYLVVATPGGAATRHLVDAQVIAALGPTGTLVNIARGSVVDTAALAAARWPAGNWARPGWTSTKASPRRPEELVGLPNVVLTPHIAGRSPEAMQGVRGQVPGQCPGLLRWPARADAGATVSDPT